MFYQFDDEILSVNADELKDNTLTAAYLSYDELNSIYKRLSIPFQAVELCKGNKSELFSGIEIYDDCFFIRLNALGKNMQQSSICIIVIKNILVFVNVCDNNFLNRDLFMKTMSRICFENASLEKLLTSFFEALVLLDDLQLESLRKSIAVLEESVIKNNADKKFNIKLLEIKRKILAYRGYYERLIDISQVLCDNDNELFDDSIKRIERFTEKLKRLKDSVDILSESVSHLWDAYQASLDMKLNETMKLFTLMTTIFFPLTVIAGWYGMNFASMPEINWKYGYAYAILLSIAVISTLIFIFKKKKWI